MLEQKVDQILRDILECDVRFNFAANSMIFHFETKGNYSVWIDPFWRFVKDGQLISSSMSCPRQSDYNNDTDYDNAFHDWCHKVKYLKLIKIVNIQRHSNMNDLLISWEDGTSLEVYQAINDSQAWYIHDWDIDIYYYVFPNRITEKKK